MSSFFLVFATLFSFGATLSLPPNIHTRQASALKTGSWIITYQPSAPDSPLYKGPLRITSTSDSTFISGDLYNGTVVPNPADGSPILPRDNYWSFVRTTGYTTGSNRGFSLDLEYYAFGGFVERPRYHDTIWANSPTDGGYTVDLAPATAPTGYPDAENYFTGDVKITSSGEVVGQFTMGWVSSYLRRIELEIGTVSGLAVPETDSTGTRSWKSILGDVGWDINVNVGATDIPEPTNPEGPGFWTNEQQHEAVLEYRSPTDFDKEWKYYLLVVKKMVGVARGAMIDPTRIYNGVPREGTTMSSEWIVGTNADGTNDTAHPWPSSVIGKKFVELHDSWYRTAVHEVGHCFGLAHPGGYENYIMTDTGSFVIAGADGTTPEEYPDNITAETLRFSPHNVFKMQHRPDTHVRPGMVDFGAPAQDKVPPETSNLQG